MNLLNKITIKNLKLNKKRTVVTIIGIILSVALITAVSSIYLSGLDSIKKFEIEQKGNFHMAFLDVKKEELGTFQENRGFENIYLTSNIGYAKLLDSQNKLKPYAFVKAFTKTSLDNLAIKLVSGRLPQNSKEIVIPTHLRTNGKIKLQVGDTINLDVGKRLGLDGEELTQDKPYQVGENDNSAEDIVNTTPKTYKIVGIIERPSSNIENYSAPGYTFITLMNDKKLPALVDVYAQFTKKALKNRYSLVADILNIDSDIWTEFNEKGYVNENKMQYIANPKYQTVVNNYLIGLETNPINVSGVGQMIYVVIIVCAIIVFTSIFCIKNSFDISISEKIKQYGMLRSVGATKKQIRKNVLYEGFILGLIGIPLGIIFGLLAAFILILVSNYFLAGAIMDSLSLRFSFSYLAILIAIILGSLTIYFSSLRSALKASKVSPIESIRNSANIKIKPQKLKNSALIHNLFGIGGDISYKNMKRNKKKYRTTIISLAVSVSVFIALSSFMQYAFLTLKNEVNIYDYNILISVDSKNQMSNVREVTQLEGVNNYSLYRGTLLSEAGILFNPQYLKNNSLKSDAKEDDITVAAFGEKTYQEYLKSLGLNYEEIKDKGILFDNIKYTGKDNKPYQTREYLLKKGDNIEGVINEQNVNLNIGYVAKSLPFGMSNEQYNSIIIISDELFDRLYPDNATLVAYLDVKDAMQFQNKVEELMQDNEYYLNNMDENVRMLRNLYTLVGIFLYGFIIVVSLIGITNIFNTITTNMHLRRQEFAMLKSIGMTKKEFTKMIRLESTFIGFKALIFGLSIGIVLSYIIYHFLVGENIMAYIPPIGAILISILVVFLLISVIMKYSLNKINKQNTIETIRSENI